MRVVIVHNSGAGENRYNPDSLVRLIRRAGHEAAYFSSKDAAWKGAVGDRADVVAVAGGDGTVAEVATAMAGRLVPIAVLPLGTANNISRALGQANLPLEDLVANWTAGRRQLLDIGVARGPWGMFRFLESVGAGLLAESMAEIKAGRADYIRQAKRADGRMAAALGLFRRLLGRMTAMRFDVSVDGRDRSGEYLLLEVLNFGDAGPNLRLAPDAVASDGLLDVVLVDEPHRDDLADQLSLSQTDSLHTSALPVYQGRHVTLSCERCTLHLDDEVWTQQRAGKDPIVIDLFIEPQALTFLVPRA